MKGNGGGKHGKAKYLPGGMPSFALMLTVAAVALAIFIFLQNGKPLQAPGVDGETDYFTDGREAAVFVKTVDGDTAWFKMGGETYKVRFLGVDSPEIYTEDGDPEPYSEKAAMFVTDILGKATSVVLESDPLSDTYDSYDRLLCWVWADGELLNTRLVAEGLADVRYIYDDYMYVDELYEMREYAREEGMGMWR